MCPWPPVNAQWVVDASGRGKVLKAEVGTGGSQPHSPRFNLCWVEGLVNIEKITGRSHQEILYDPKGSWTGHFQFFLATNHCCPDGQWSWVSRCKTRPVSAPR